MNKTHRILYASDVHGSNLVFDKLLASAVDLKVDAVVIGGDLSGKQLWPFVRQDGYFQTPYDAKRGKVSNRRLQVEKDSVSNQGNYPIVCSYEEYEALRSNPQEVESLFRHHIEVRLAQWFVKAEGRLKPHNIRFIVIAGNDDEWELDQIIQKNSFVECPEYDQVMIGSHSVIGESRTNVTPFNCPRDVTEKQLQKSLQRQIAKVADPGRAILLSHCPPFDSTLDLAPALDQNLRVKLLGGEAEVKPVGSTSVRKVIEQHQPLISLHGHIHESPGVINIGRTMCFNAGSEYFRGTLRGLLIELSRDQVLNHSLCHR